MHSVYRDQAQFIVIFCSKEYARKIWPSHELESAQERALKENVEYILPVRFDDTEIPGLPSTVSYIDARDKSPNYMCNLITRKLEVMNGGSSNTKVNPEGEPVSDLRSALKTIQRKTKFLWLELLETKHEDLSCSSEIMQTTVELIQPALDFLESHGYFRSSINFAYEIESKKEKVMKISLDYIEPRLLNLAHKIEEMNPRKAVRY